MNREQKAAVIESLKQSFAQSQASFLVNYKGLTVAEVQELRKKLRANDGEMSVAKARLMKLASQGNAGAELLSPYFKEQIALVFANKEMAPIAKTITEFAKNHKALTIVVGSADHALMDAKAINTIANLPSREVLLAMLCGVLNAPMASLARVVNLIKENKEKQQ